MSDFDILDRDRVRKQTSARRAAVFQARFPGDDWSLATICFRIACFEVLPEEQWQRVLERTAEMVTKVTDE